MSVVKLPYWLDMQMTSLYFTKALCWSTIQSSCSLFLKTHLILYIYELHVVHNLTPILHHPCIDSIALGSMTNLLYKHHNLLLLTSPSIIVHGSVQCVYECKVGTSKYGQQELSKNNNAYKSVFCIVKISAVYLR